MSPAINLRINNGLPGRSVVGAIRGLGRWGVGLWLEMASLSGLAEPSLRELEERGPTAGR